MNNASYTAASVLPAKLVADDVAIPLARRGHIKPMHIQINPTNKCPMECSFCSCKNRDKNLEMDFQTAIVVVKKFQKLGCKAVTITGGGDPMEWEPINEFIYECNMMGIELGLVTDAIHLSRLKYRSALNLTWMRVSASYQNPTPKIGEYHLYTDVGISYVIAGNDAQRDAWYIVNLYLNNPGITHMRIVEDILDPDCSTVEQVRLLVEKDLGFQTKIIWQGRKKYGLGAKRCLISLLKPNLSPSGLVTPCCGVQYASNPPTLNFTKQFSMGTISDIDRIWGDQAFFDGSICERCYYSAYNDVLNAVYNAQMDHENFL